MPQPRGDDSDRAAVADGRDPIAEWSALLKHFLLQAQDPMDAMQVSATLREAKGNPELCGRAAAATLPDLLLQSPAPSHAAITAAIKLIKAGDMGLREWYGITEAFDEAIARGHRLSNLRRMFINRCRDLVE